MEKYTPKLKVTKVAWECPSPGWVKINTDGVSRGNPERSSIGFVLRNEQGDVLYASSKEIQEGTNTEAEARAVLEALKYCAGHDYILIDLHTDSVLVKNVVEGVWSVPWAVAVLNKGCKEIRGVKERSSMEEEKECSIIVCHLVQIPLEENLVVLALSAHSLEGVLLVNTSMEARRTSSVLGTEIAMHTFNYRRYKQGTQTTGRT
ncbi:uncharacterized protein LOC142166499 [Nicotiana tabacum]|uniref:Uncharacterized protein LOC142166499 n=1 Tax=Nicotiana tabacum TaxID=4097 RepID=A0AC58SAH9_TOBAC